ncbi:hypothetical protein [Agrobacterium tumefaciens]
MAAFITLSHLSGTHRFDVWRRRSTWECACPFPEIVAVSKGVRPGTLITQNFGTANSAG